jgi:hypothetical protein
MDRDFEMNGRKYKLHKIDTFKQFHIARRIGPILADLFPALQTGVKIDAQKGVEKLSEDEQLELIGKFAGPIMTGLSKLSDADSEFVLFGLLQSIEMQQAQGNWMRVATNSVMMAQDLELGSMLQLAGRAFMFNLSGFFGALRQ